jgi:LPS-assembly lipoprotein
MGLLGLVFGRRVICALALGPAILLGGCFRPMYATYDGAVAPGLVNDLSSISIESSPDRVTNRVRENLLFNFTGGAEPPAPRYKLGLGVSTAGAPQVVSGTTLTLEIAIITLKGNFVLVDAKTNKALFSGTAYARKSYSGTLQYYAANRAATNAMNTAAVDLADQIRTQLAIYLAAHH